MHATQRAERRLQRMLNQYFPGARLKVRTVREHDGGFQTGEISLTDTSTGTQHLIKVDAMDLCMACTSPVGWITRFHDALTSAGITVKNTLPSGAKGREGV